MDGRLAAAHDDSNTETFLRYGLALIRSDRPNCRNEPAVTDKKTRFNNRPGSMLEAKSADVVSAIERDAFGNRKARNRLYTSPAFKRNSKRTGRGRMGFLKNHGLALIMAVNILPASFLAKNMISYPLGYDFSCSYGVPLAVWETYSIDQAERSRVISGAYHVSAIEIGEMGSPPATFHLFVDSIIFLAVLYLLQKRENESRWKKGLRKCSLALALFLSLSLWLSVFSSWESGIYRFSYLTAVVLEILLFLSAIIKGVTACSVRRAEQLPTSRAA